MDLELRQLRAFIAVVDEGSFTAAGIALGLSQASVSRAVAALERAVGAPVLHRTTREMTLSAGGVRIIGHARRVLEETAAIIRAAEDPAGEIRVGYAWSALGEHTTTAQQRWAAEHPGSVLRFVQSDSPTTGLAEGVAELAVLRRPLHDDRFTTVLVGVEPRYGAVASGDRLARRRHLSLDDFTGRAVGIDVRTGTTTLDLWPPGGGPASTPEVSGVDEWLTLIAAGQALGLSSAATARQHPRPGITYRPVRDAPPVAVMVAWWRRSPPPQAAAIVRLLCDLYGSPSPDQRR